MELFVYVKATYFVDELKEKIKLAFNIGKRTNLAFVTVSAPNKDNLQGIITSRDII